MLWFISLQFSFTSIQTLNLSGFIFLVSCLTFSFKYSLHFFLSSWSIRTNLKDSRFSVRVILVSRRMAATPGRAASGNWPNSCASFLTSPRNFLQSLSSFASVIILRSFFFLSSSVRFLSSRMILIIPRRSLSGIFSKKGKFMMSGTSEGSFGLLRGLCCKGGFALWFKFS